MFSLNYYLKKLSNYFSKMLNIIARNLHKWCGKFKSYNLHLNRVQIVQQKRHLNQNIRLYKLPVQRHFNAEHSFNNSKNCRIIIALNILAWLGFTEDDEKKESELIMTIKRAILCTRREQYEKAEQMLHLALRLAQQQQNQQGVLYCYDLMANLAMDTSQLDKAEKLFVSVLQMLLGSGTEQDDLKVIHISLKMARISHLKADEKKAELGYKWCLEQIAKHNKRVGESGDSKLLSGVIHDWYAQYLLDVGKNAESLQHLKEAHDACQSTKDINYEKNMLLLNDLGITHFRIGNLEMAEMYLMEAIKVGLNLEDKSHVGVVHANLGLILLEKGVLKEAEKYCAEAWKLGKRHENIESVEQANYCFDQIKQNFQK